MDVVPSKENKNKIKDKIKPQHICTLHTQITPPPNTPSGGICQVLGLHRQEFVIAKICPGVEAPSARFWGFSSAQNMSSTN